CAAACPFAPRRTTGQGRSGSVIERRQPDPYTPKPQLPAKSWTSGRFPPDPRLVLPRMDGVEIRRSRRARRWRVEVPWDRPARLVVPQWMSQAEIDRVLADRRGGIGKQGGRQGARLGPE